MRVTVRAYACLFFDALPPTAPVLLRPFRADEENLTRRGKKKIAVTKLERADTVGVQIVSVSTGVGTVSKTYRRNQGNVVHGTDCRTYMNVKLESVVFKLV